MSVKATILTGTDGQQVLPKTRAELVYVGSVRLSDYLTSRDLVVSSVIGVHESRIESLEGFVTHPVVSDAEVGTLNVTGMINLNGEDFSSADGLIARTTANATYNGKLSKKISVNGLNFNSSVDINVGTIDVAYGGTGLTSLTSNKLMYAVNNAFQFSDIFVNRDRIGIETSRPADGVSLATAKAIHCGTSISAATDINAGGSVVAQKGVAAMGIVDADSISGLRMKAFTYANNDISADTDINLDHNLGNANPLVYILETNTTSTGDNDYKPMVHGTGGSTMYVKFVNENRVAINIGSTHASHKVKVYIIG